MTRRSLDETVTRLERRGWQVTRTGEADVAAGRVPVADLYVNMCQGPAASSACSSWCRAQALGRESA